MCSPFDTLNFVEETTGSPTVNYCGFLPCTGPQPQWGWVEILNGREIMVINFQMATGWFIDASQSEFSIGSNFQFNSNGVPITQNDWFSVDVSPVRNSWQFTVPLDSIGLECFDMAVNLTVVKMSFFGGQDANSSRRLWIKNNDWNNPNSEHAAPSPFLYHWCIGQCAPDPSDCTPSYTTYTQCQYGSCGSDGPAATYCNANFSTVFPNGLNIGCDNGFHLSLSSAAAVSNFLPTDGSAVPLLKNYNDPLGEVASNSTYAFCGDVSAPTTMSGVLNFDYPTVATSGTNYLAAGTIVNTQWEDDFGVTISGNSAGAGSGNVVLFDANAPTGGDTDLGTKNRAYGGPGIGTGGGAGNGRNNVQERNILVLSGNDTDANLDGRVDAPNDDEAGGTIHFEFDQPMTIQYVTLLDVNRNITITLDFEDSRPDLVISSGIWGANSKRQVFTKEADNSYADKVIAMHVTFPAGGGGIVNMAYAWESSYVGNSCINTYNVLTCGLPGPNSCRNVLAGRLVAAKMNVEFDAYDANFSPSLFPIGYTVISSGVFEGMTVNQVVAEANDFIGGCGSSYTGAQLSWALNEINKSFMNGVQNSTYIVCPAIQ